MDIPTKIAYSDDRELPFDKDLIVSHQKFLAELREIQPNLSIKKTTLKTICTNIGRKNRKVWKWEERDIQKFATKVGERIRLMAMHTGALLRKKFPPKWALAAFPPPPPPGQVVDAILEEAAIGDEAVGDDAEEEEEEEDELEDEASTVKEDEVDGEANTMKDESSLQDEPDGGNSGFFEDGQRDGLWHACHEDDRSAATSDGMEEFLPADGAATPTGKGTRNLLARGKSSVNLLSPAPEKQQQEKLAYFVGFDEQTGLAWRAASDNPDAVPEYTDDIDVHPDVSTEFATAAWAGGQFRHLLSSVTAERWTARKSALAAKRGVKKERAWEEGNFFILHRPQKGRTALFFLYDKTKSLQKQVRNQKFQNYIKIHIFKFSTLNILEI